MTPTYIHTNVLLHSLTIAYRFSDWLNFLHSLTIAHRFSDWLNFRQWTIHSIEIKSTCNLKILKMLIIASFKSILWEYTVVNYVSFYSTISLLCMKFFTLDRHLATGVFLYTSHYYNETNTWPSFASTLHIKATLSKGCLLIIVCNLNMKIYTFVIEQT